MSKRNPHSFSADDLQELIGFAYAEPGDLHNITYPNEPTDVLNRLHAVGRICGRVIPMLGGIFPQHALERGPLASEAALAILLEGVEGAGIERFVHKLEGRGLMELYSGLKAPLEADGVAVAAHIGDIGGIDSDGFMLSVSSPGSSDTGYEPFGKHVYVHPEHQLAVVTLARPDCAFELREDNGICRLELESDGPFDLSELGEPDSSILDAHGLPGFMYRQVQTAARLVCQAVQLEP